MFEHRFWVGGIIFSPKMTPMEISDAPVSGVPQNLSLCCQAVTYYISGIFDIFFFLRAISF